MPGRFRLGVGSGENLNEHILGKVWPPVRVRLEMLEEAVGIMRRLWEGGIVTEHTAHYTVENARLYTLPNEFTSCPGFRIRSQGNRNRRSRWERFRHDQQT